MTVPPMFAADNPAMGTGNETTKAIAEVVSANPVYNYVYFYEDGRVTTTIGRDPSTRELAGCYMAMASIPATGNAKPYVEIIKSRLGYVPLVLATDVVSTAVEVCETCGKNDGTLSRGTFTDQEFHVLCGDCSTLAMEYSSTVPNASTWAGFCEYVIDEASKSLKSYEVIVEDVNGDIFKVPQSKWYDSIDELPFTEEENNKAALVEMMEFNRKGICTRKAILRDHAERGTNTTTGDVNIARITEGH